MPVIVVGADTPIGAAIMPLLAARQGEVRAFISDVGVAQSLRSEGVKVAIGDLSDASHVGAAGINCFSMIFVTSAAYDDRERSFASTPTEVFASWQEAIIASGVRRAIWVEDHVTVGSAATVRAPELAVVDSTQGTLAEVAQRVADIDEAASLDTPIESE